MHASILGVFSLIAVAVPDIASAQPPTPPTLQAFIASPPFQAYIGSLFSKLPPDVFQRCKSFVSKGSTVSVAIPAVFASDGHPISGAWKQSFPVSGCGNDTTINFFFTAQASENIVTVMGAPGDTHADPILQKDAIHYAMLAALPKAGTCTEPHILTTRYDGVATMPREDSKASAHSGKQPWHETWTIAACGSTIRIGMNFIPDAPGTTVSTELIK